MYQSPTPIARPALSGRVLNRLANAALLLALLLGLPMASALANINPPSVSVSDTSNYSVGGSAVVVAPNLTISDDDNENIDGARVAITTNFNSSTDRLGISGQGTATSGAVSGLSWSYGTGTGVLSISGVAAVSTYQAALRQMIFYTTGSPAANARTVQFSLGSSVANPANGHFYEYISTPTLTWTNARTAAAGRTLFGLQGYLVTVTSAAEQSFVSNKLAGSTGWLGANDASVNKVWRWVTGPEGTEDGGQGRLFFRQNGWTSDAGPNGCGIGPSVGNQPVGQYSNWNPSEPNDYSNGCAGNENYGQFVTTSGQWNDLSNSNSLGYVVEYGGSAGDPVLNIPGNATVNVVYTPTINNVTPSNGPTAGGT
nr:hypothetical protein [Chloroflexota bacterium]